MSIHRKPQPDLRNGLFSIITKFFELFPQPDFETFDSDIFLDETINFSEYGWNARVIHLPGHSDGSVGFLTEDGNLFCGDLFMNFIRPALHFHIDDLEKTRESVEKLKNLSVKTVFPGHGRSFEFDKAIKHLRIE